MCYVDVAQGTVEDCSTEKAAGSHIKILINHKKVDCVSENVVNPSQKRNSVEHFHKVKGLARHTFKKEIVDADIFEVIITFMRDAPKKEKKKKDPPFRFENNLMIHNYTPV